jgi:hypothetical protein
VGSSGTRWSPTYLTQVRSESNTMTKSRLGIVRFHGLVWARGILPVGFAFDNGATRRWPLGLAAARPSYRTAQGQPPSHRLEHVSRSWVLLVLSALTGALLGLFMSSLPAPSDIGTFWVGNFSAPWAVLAFGAGWAQRSRLWAAIGGVAAEVACVAGFYAQGLVFDPRGLFGPAPYPGLLTVIETGLSRWLWFIAPWVAVAIGAGVLYSLLGRWWGQSRSIVAGVAIALPFIVEPVAWRVYDGFARGPLVVWFVEIAVGITLLGWVLVARRPLTPRNVSSSCG